MFLQLIGLNKLSAQIPGHVYWLDRNNIFLGCNDLQAAAGGRNSVEEMIGKTNYDMPWEEQASTLNRTNIQVMATGREYILEEIARYVDGEHILLTKKVPLFDNQSNIIGIAGISIDITNTKQIGSGVMNKNQVAANSSSDIFRDNFYLNSTTKRSVDKLDQILFSSLRVILETTLTIRETQCLCLWLSGYSIKYTAKALLVSNKTIETHRANILSKLGLFNKDQLIDLIISRNMLHQYVYYAKKYFN